MFLPNLIMLPASLLDPVPLTALGQIIFSGGVADVVVFEALCTAQGCRRRTLSRQGGGAQPDAVGQPLDALTPDAIKGDDAARHFAGHHLLIATVDISQSDALRDQFVEHKLTRKVQLRQLRDQHLKR